MIELPSWPDIGVAIVVGCGAAAIISLISLFVALHGVLYKLVPAYCLVLSLGILFNYPDVLEYAHPSLKVLRSSRVAEGPLILKFLGVLLLGYAAASYNVGNSKCSVTKCVNALLIALGGTGVLLTLTGETSLTALFTVCLAKRDACIALALIVGSFLVALGHYLSPKIEDYLANSGCSARTKVAQNAQIQGAQR